jgi:hypothetical protein|nr:MAG TPA: tail fiber protein [Caudoviricetes sp.]
MAINVSKWSSHSKLSKPVGITDTELPIRFGEGVRFHVPCEDYFYATIRSHGKYEHVKVLAVKGDVLHVVRGQDNTAAQSWPAESCVEVEWNPAQLCEFSRQCVLGTAPTTVDAGVYCLDCNTCITIGEDGRITAVNGEKSCQ